MESYKMLNCNQRRKKRRLKKRNKEQILQKENSYKHGR